MIYYRIESESSAYQLIFAVFYLMIYYRIESRPRPGWARGEGEVMIYYRIESTSPGAGGGEARGNRDDLL